MSKICYIAILSLTALLMSACSPMYKTTYRQVPPSSERGQRCIEQCTHTKNMCERLCSEKQHLCVKRRKLEHRDMKDKGDSYNLLFKESCEQQCHCDDDFVSCFKMCGGILVPEKKCVAFCE